MLKNLAKAILPKSWRLRIRALQSQIETIWDFRRGIKALGLYINFFKELRRYRALKDAEKINFVDLWPVLFEKTPTHPLPAHLFYQSAWASRRILQTRPARHVDIGSQLELLAVLSAQVPVVFIDIRPLQVTLSNVQSIAASILALPFIDNSVSSLSCLHVIDHIGLARYGDPFDPKGSEKAAKELIRVLAPGGSLFLSAPIGRERVCFNAHRIHSPQTILRYFKELELVEFSCEDATGFREKANPAELENAIYACGFFWFRKKSTS